MELLSNYLSNIFCCKNRTTEINPPTINRDNKPEFVNENKIYINYIKINRNKNTYSNYDDFDYNQPLPDILDIPQLFNKEIKYK